MTQADGLALWTLASRPDLKKAYGAIESGAWGSLGYLNFSASFPSDYFGLLQEFADHQLCLVDDNGYPVVVANTLPLPFVPPSDLPDEGWDWIVNQARAHGTSSPTGKTMLGALAISVPNVHRRKGVARRMIQEVSNFARRQGYQAVVVPVRPSDKSQHPWVPMREYIGWRDEHGRLFDPWLRSHAAVGGRIVGPCASSMVVDEPVGFWEIWAKQRFERSGEYLVPGCLAPVHIDLKSGRGRYSEPGVWVVYEL
jgi:predicted GNAT family acetyltransferase